MKETPFETSTVSSKGQLVIPVRIRRRFGIKPGTEVRFIERQGEIFFQPVTKEFIRSLRGFLKSETSITQDLLRERKAEREADEASLAGHRTR